MSFKYHVPLLTDFHKTFILLIAYILSPDIQGDVHSVRFFLFTCGWKPKAYKRRKITTRNAVFWLFRREMRIFERNLFEFSWLGSYRCSLLLLKSLKKVKSRFYLFLLCMLSYDNEWVSEFCHTYVPEWKGLFYLWLKARSMSAPSIFFCKLEKF